LLAERIAGWSEKRVRFGPKHRLIGSIGIGGGVVVEERVQKNGVPGSQGSRHTWRDAPFETPVRRRPFSLTITT
jgi:hypothetical protein